MGNIRNSLLLLAMVLLPAPVFGAEGNICLLIQEAIAEGRDTRVLVRNALELGHQPCLVIRCAVEGLGEPSKIFNGAMDVGVSAAVFSRCAVDAGLDAGQVATLVIREDLAMGLCYFGPSGTESGGAIGIVVEPIIASPPDFISSDDEAGRPTISPVLPSGL